MADDALRVEFKVRIPKRRPEPVPAPVDRGERQRLDRAARRARNLALAYWIDQLIRSGEVADLAKVARMCGVSRARITSLSASLSWPSTLQEIALRPPSSVSSAPNFGRALPSHL
jgi:hypothetical protein